MSDLEKVNAPQIGGTLPHDHYIKALHSIAVSLKRIADSLEKPVVSGDPGIPVYASRDATNAAMNDEAIDKRFPDQKPE